MATGEPVAKILRPSSRQPSPLRRARRGRAGEVLARLADRGRDHRAVAGDGRQRGGDRRRVARLAGRLQAPPVARDVGDRRHVHVHADRQRRVALRQPARGDDQVVHGLHAHPAERRGHGGGVEAGVPQRLGAREREAGLAVVVGRALGELRGEPGGQGVEATPRLRGGGELEGRGHRGSSGGAGREGAARAASTARAGEGQLPVALKKT